MSNKRKRDEIAAAQERFNKRTIVIERGVLKPDIRMAPFDFVSILASICVWTKSLVYVKMF